MIKHTTPFLYLTFFSLTSFVFFTCGNSTDGGNKDESSQSTKEEHANNDPLQNKGVGIVSEISLNEEIDAALVEKGESVYKSLCTACHKIDEKYIGPALAGIMEKRSPEWIMNMIIDPELMIEKDPIARQLYREYNRSPMLNQNVSEEDARAILEYLRTLE